MNMKLYFDMNIYNRIFDDQSQVRIRFETLAINIIFELIEKGVYVLVWSYILDYENSRNTYNKRRLYIQSTSGLCREIVTPHDDIRLTAKKIAKDSNTKEKDALHMACAVYCGCDFFITCDDKLIKTIIRNQNKLDDTIRDIIVINPVDFLRKELNISVIE